MPASPRLQLADKSEAAGGASCLLQLCLSPIREKRCARLVSQTPAERRFKVMRLMGLVLGTTILMVGYAWEQDISTIHYKLNMTLT